KPHPESVNRLLAGPDKNRRSLQTFVTRLVTLSWWRNRLGRVTFRTMKFLRHFFALLVTAVALVAAEVPKVTPADAAKLVADGKAVIVDCREPSEWKETGVAA